MNKNKQNKPNYMTKETKQTALEQFAIALYEKGLLIGNGNWMQDVLQEFKEIEKEQIIEAFDEGQEYEYQYHINSTPKFDSETYYNETYGGNK
jgi:hypothetical protein